MSTILNLHDINVFYGGNQALRDVSLRVTEGSLTGLIGPNGAGKTTLFNAICGLLSPTSGQVFLKEANITKKSTHKRAKLGLARTFQRLELFSSLTVRDNIRVAGEIAGRTLGVAEETQRIIELVGLTAIADREVTEIPTGQARIVELARALMTHPQILLLDEPASGQTETETEQFGALLKDLQGQGHTILLVEHDMSLVMSVCDEIHVMDFGQIIAVGKPSEIRNNPDVLSAYLGNDESQENN